MGYLSGATCREKILAPAILVKRSSILGRGYESILPSTIPRRLGPCPLTTIKGRVTVGLLSTCTDT